jgi:hypothetical protein
VRSARVPVSNAAMQHRLIVAATLLGLAAGTAVAHADVADRWVAIDKIAVSTDTASGVPQLQLTGVREGAAAPETYPYGVFASGGTSTEVLARCEKYALLAQARPGRYALEIVRYDGMSNGYYTMKVCRLARVD